MRLDSGRYVIVILVSKMVKVAKKYVTAIIFTSLRQMDYIHYALGLGTVYKFLWQSDFKALRSSWL